MPPLLLSAYIWKYDYYGYKAIVGRDDIIEKNYSP